MTRVMDKNIPPQLKRTIIYNTGTFDAQLLDYDQYEDAAPGSPECDYYIVRMDLQYYYRRMEDLIPGALADLHANGYSEAAIREDSTMYHRARSAAKK